MIDNVPIALACIFIGFPIENWQQITHHHWEYEEELEQIAFDISHVLRRPVTSLVGLSSLIDTNVIKDSRLKYLDAHKKLSQLN